jgi:CheY-like chemotaxis protein
MPEMDGYTVAKELRSTAQYQAVPRIAITGFDQSSRLLELHDRMVWTGGSRRQAQHRERLSNDRVPSAFSSQHKHFTH